MDNIKLKYNKPEYDKIKCSCFGQVDGMDGSCHDCLYDTPCQFEMCSDESWKRSLIKGISFNPMADQEAIDFINDYKGKYHKPSKQATL